MTRISLLLVVLTYLFFVPLSGQALLEDAKVLSHIFEEDSQNNLDLTFEILDSKPIQLDFSRSYSTHRTLPSEIYVKPNDTLEIAIEPNYRVKWLISSDSMRLVENPNDLKFKKEAFKIVQFSKNEAEYLTLIFTILNYHIHLSYFHSEIDFLDRNGNFTDDVGHLFLLNKLLPEAHRVMSIKVIKPIKGSVENDAYNDAYNKDLIIYRTTTNNDSGLEEISYQPNLKQTIKDITYQVRYTKPSIPYYIKFKKGDTILKMLPIEKSGLDFEFDEAQQTILVKQYHGIKQKWERFDIPRDTFIPEIKHFYFNNNLGLVEAGYGRLYFEHPPFFSREKWDNFLSVPAFKKEFRENNIFQFEFEIPTTGESLHPLFLQDNEVYSLKIRSPKEGDVNLKLGEIELNNIPVSPSGISLQLTKMQKKLIIERPVRIPLPVLKIPITTKRASVISLLGRYNFINLENVEQPNLYSTISDAYRQNSYLNTALSKYFAKGFGNQLSATTNETLKQEIVQNLATQEWQQIKIGEQKSATTESSYREVIEAYRTPINTAADNLQLASQQFENETKKLRKGLNATTIAAGLSDFIVERAQEELNLTFLDRLRNSILNDTSEFKKLFPQTRDMLLDFEVDKYQTLLNFAKKAFVQDLQNLGMNFPRLFELQKYERLKNDPNVFNIFLIYDIANQIYEGMPIEAVLLKLNQRLQDRRQSLNQTINLALADTLQQNPDLQKILINEVGDYMDEVRYIDEEIDNARVTLEQLMRQYGDNSLANKLNSNVPTRNIVLGQFRENLTEEGIRNPEEFILLKGADNDPNVQLQQYETLTPLHLQGDPAYWYTLKKLPFADTKVFFDEQLPPSSVIATGINQLRQLLTSTPENIYSTWLNRLEEGVKAAKASRDENAASNRSKQLEDLKDLQARRATIYLGLLQEIKFWKERLKTGYLTKNGKQQVAHSVRHDYESIQYLLDVFKKPSGYNVYDWQNLDKLTDYIVNTKTNIGGQAEQEIFFQNMPIPIETVIVETNQFLDDFAVEIEQRVQKLQRKFGSNSPILLAHYAETAQFFRTFMRHPNIYTVDKVFDYYPFISEMETQLKQPTTAVSPASELPPFNAPINVFLAACDQLPQQLVTETYAVSRDQQFNDLEEMIERTRRQFELLVAKKVTLNAHFDNLESSCITKLFKARQHANQLSQLVQLSTHILYALKADNQASATINVVDSVLQEVKRIRIKPNGETVEITYDSLILNTRTIADGTNARQWIQPSQLAEIAENEHLQKAFYGLLSERLRALNPDFNYSEKNLKLVMNKAVFAINEIDEQRALLQHKKSTSQVLSFNDYYPFIRATIDLLNVVIQTPIYREVSFLERYPQLKNLPNISDQSLSLFENIFAENYPDALQNVIGLLAIIWDVDLAIALAEEQARIAQANTNSLNKGAIKKIKRKKLKSSKKLKSKLLVYGSFMANVVGAQNANQVKAAIRAVAVPPGSSSVKRKTDFNVSFNAYFGLGFHQELLTNSLIPDSEKRGSTIGLSVPVGVSASLGALGKNNNWGLSLFVPILDVGGVTAFRLSDDGTTGELPELTFSNLISPGGYLMLNLPKSPFSIGLGAQYGPQVRKITINETELNSSAWKFGITASIDVPIFNLFSR